MIKKLIWLIFLNWIICWTFVLANELSLEKQQKLNSLIGKMAKVQARTKSERKRFLEANLDWIKKMSSTFKKVSHFTAKAENGDDSAIIELKTLEQNIQKGFKAQPLPPEKDALMSELASDTGSAFSDGHTGLKKIIKAFEERDAVKREIATQRAAHYMGQGGEKLRDVRKRTEEGLSEIN